MMNQLDLFAEWDEFVGKVEKELAERKKTKKPSKKVESKMVEDKAHDTNQNPWSCVFCMHVKPSSSNGWYWCNAWNVETLGDNDACEKSDLYKGEVVYGNLYRVDGNLVAGTGRLSTIVGK